MTLPEYRGTTVRVSACCGRAIIFGRVAAVIKAERDFLLARLGHESDWCGMSSDAMVAQEIRAE